jgi:amidohydrolase
VTDAKAAARTTIEGARDDLLELSHRIHANPEVGWCEERASAWTAEALEAGGLDIWRPDGLPTAFVARAGAGPLHVAICAEYDALPRIGHACGHNVIAAAAVGAGLALAPLADAAGLTVSVMGTPAEEGGGGKVAMLERGLFEGVHAAMMVHPAPFDDPAPRLIAAAHLRIAYTGREAHAAAAPELGVNAADALTVAQVALGLLRQHVRRTDLFHGIVTDGGAAPNVVPAHTEADYIVRSPTSAGLEALLPRVRRCFEAGALATGATLEVTEEPTYAEVRTDPDLAALYRRNAEALGRAFPPPEAVAGRFPASTDFGNVSLAVPAIHPLIGIECGPSVNHQPGFAAACATPSADRAVVDGAIAMAWTALDAAADEGLRRRLTDARG